MGTVHPELIDEWDFEKNEPLRPEHVTAGSHKKVWWHCENGHSWKTVVYHRHIGRNCPYCLGLLAIPGETDFGSVLPELADEWDAERNEGIAPEDFKPYSNKRVWWRCENGHHWLSTVGARFAGAGCPYAVVKYRCVLGWLRKYKFMGITKGNSMRSCPLLWS